MTTYTLYDINGFTAGKFASEVQDFNARCAEAVEAYTHYKVAIVTFDCAREDWLEVWMIDTGHVWPEHFRLETGVGNNIYILHRGIGTKLHFQAAPVALKEGEEGVWAESVIRDMTTGGITGFARDGMTWKVTSRYMGREYRSVWTLEEIREQGKSRRKDEGEKDGGKADKEGQMKDGQRRDEGKAKGG